MLRFVGRLIFTGKLYFSWPPLLQKYTHASPSTMMKTSNKKRSEHTNDKTNSSRYTLSSVKIVISLKFKKQQQNLYFHVGDEAQLWVKKTNNVIRK